MKPTSIHYSQFESLYANEQRFFKHIIARYFNGAQQQDVLQDFSIHLFALLDLSDITLALIQQYKDNDDVIFFLGRLVWQGNMPNCVEDLFTVALNSHRDVYARIASVRAVFSLGH